MDQITLKNFRCFREQQIARLAPLTLLVGENSTGKTSFMAMIRALWDIAYRHRVPDFKEDPYELGSFDEIVHHRSSRGRRAKTFEAWFSFQHGSGRSKSRPYRFRVMFEKVGTAPLPVEWRLSNGDDDVWIEESRRDNAKWQLGFGTPKGSWRFENFVGLALRAGGTGRLMTGLLFVLSVSRGDFREHRDLVSASGNGEPEDSDLKLIEQLCRSVFPGFSGEQLFASAPVRSKPHRTYDPAHSLRDPEGEYIPMYLADIYFQDNERWKRLKNAIEEFGKGAGLFDEIAVKPFGKTASVPFQVQIRIFGHKDKEPRRNLIDVGYGVSQVLPVITELLRGDAPPMFLLQQPEVHLHPSAQAALGSLFCQIASPKRRLVVETHSDHMLKRIRMDVRDGKAALKPEDVSILFFERGDLDVRIHSLRLDREGNVLDAPDSYGRFFLEETARSLWSKSESGG